MPCNHRRGLSFGCWKFSLEEEVEVGVVCYSCFDFDYMEFGCQSSSWYVGRNVIDKLGVLILAMGRFGDCVCQCEEFGNHRRCLGFGTRRMLMISALPVSRLESF